MLVPTSRALALLESEAASLSASIKRGQLWSRSAPESPHPELVDALLELRRLLASATELPRPDVFLAPFLAVVKAETVTGPVTGAALDILGKFLAYGLLHPDQHGASAAAEQVADAVTHARFVGVDPAADEIVLMKIMSVLRALTLSPVGPLLTNESVCEIMQSTFRICFETRLSELLRKTAEHSLADMIRLLFARLPEFSEESLPTLKRLKMRSGHGGGDGGRAARRRQRAQQRAQQVVATASKTAAPSASASPRPAGDDKTVPRSQSTSRAELAPKATEENLGQKVAESATPSKEEGVVGSAISPMQEKQFSVDTDVLARSPMGSVTDLTTAVQSDVESQGPDSLPPATQDNEEPPPPEEKEDKESVAITVTSPQGTETTPASASKITGGRAEQAAADKEEIQRQEQPQQEFVNSQGVTFTPTTEVVDDSGLLIPYGLPCVRELFRFLVSLVNPHDPHNADPMVQTALSLLAAALETGADALDRFDSLLALVKDDLARNLVSLLSAERVATFSASLWLGFIVVESQRKHLKYQLEIYLSKLCDVVATESPKSTYEHKELALEALVRLYRIPGLLTQLYLNYDCDMFTSNAFEDLTKMLSKNAFPVTGLYSTHFLSLDALMTVVEAIESQCQKRVMKDKSVEKAVEEETFKIPTHEEVMALKHRKKLIATATEQFNTKPAKGISYMQEVGLIKTPVQPPEVATS